MLELSWTYSSEYLPQESNAKLCNVKCEMFLNTKPTDPLHTIFTAWFSTCEDNCSARISKSLTFSTVKFTLRTWSPGRSSSVHGVGGEVVVRLLCILGESEAGVKPTPDTPCPAGHGVSGVGLTYSIVKPEQVEERTIAGLP